MSSLNEADILWDEEPLSPEGITWDDEIDPLAQAEYNSYQFPLFQAASDAKKAVSEAEAQSSFGERGDAHQIVEDAVKEYWGDISTPFGRLWKEDHNAFRALMETGAGLWSGVAGFGANILGQLYSELSQVASGDLERHGMDWEDVKATGEAWESLFHTEATDPMAQAVLTAISAIPAGVGKFFDTLSDLVSTPAAKEMIKDVQNYLPNVPFIELTPEDVQGAIAGAMKTVGFVAELATFGKGAKLAKSKVKTKIPEAMRPKYPKQAKIEDIQAGETLVGKTRGIPGLKAAEERIKRTEEQRIETAKTLKGIRERQQQFEKRARERQEAVAIEKAKEPAEAVRTQEFKITSRGVEKVSETYEYRKIEERKQAKGITQEPGTEKATSLAAQFPEHDLKFDGVWGEGETTLYSFTPHKGPLKKKTFSVAKLDKVEIESALKDVEQRFNVPDLTPEEIAKIVNGEKPATTLDMLGLQKGYETGKTAWKAAFTGEKVKEKIKRFREEALEEVEGNPLDRMAVPYIKSRKFSDYINNMPEIGEIKPGELMRLDESTGKFIATLKDAKGKEKAAVRQSGFHAITDFQQSLKGFKDIGKLSYEWTDPTRLIQEMDQGKFGGPAQRHILWPIHSTTEAKFTWQDTWKAKVAEVRDNLKINTKKKAQAVGDVIEHLDDLEGPKVTKALKKFKTTDRANIIDAAKQYADIFKQLREEINAIRRKRGQKEIGEIKGYRPHVRETNIWTRWGFQDLKPSEIIDTPVLPDFIRPNQPWFRSALKRKGLLQKYSLERDMVKLLADYIDSAGKDIFDTNIIHHMKIHAAVMREAGLPHAAYAIERLSAEAFAGTSHWLSRGARRVVPQPVLRFTSSVRRNLTRAVFPLNFSWNLFVQTCSAGLTFARYGLMNNLKGLQYFTSKSMNQAVKQNAYSHLTKSRWGGKIAYQDVKESLGKSKRLQAGRIERAEEFLNSFTSALESGLTGHAVTAAYYHGKKLGLKGRALWEYASEGGAKTQSMYNLTDRPGLLKARETGSIAPFQTYAFEVMNTVRELNIVGVRRVVGRTGLYETMSARSVAGRALISKRLGMLSRWTAAILVTNAVADASIGRKPWRASSFLPFLAYILNGSPMAPVVGERQQRTLPVEYASDFYTGVKNLIQYGDWRKLRKWALRYHAPAGVQLERTIEGIEANAERGWVTDVRGRKQFRIPEEERGKALFTGPWGTSAGQEKLKGKDKKEKRTLRTIVK